jgi:FkbM family methyltransferase
VDAGANTGLASIFFSNKFPEARIIAIEPEASNYEMLKMNVAPYRNIITMNAALWGKNEEINVVDPGLGKWGFMTIDNDNKEKVVGDMCHKVQGITIDKLMEDLGIERIDILKIDIEGAEKEVFEVSSSWIDRVDAIIVELHERMKSGCNRSFYCGSNGFDDKWEQGEHVFLSRKKCLIKRPA